MSQKVKFDEQGQGHFEFENDNPEEVVRCCICDKVIVNKIMDSNNPYGALDQCFDVIEWAPEDVCCTKCDHQYVIPGRLFKFQSRDNLVSKPRAFKMWYISDMNGPIEYIYIIAYTPYQAWYWYCVKGYILMYDHMSSYHECTDSEPTRQKEIGAVFGAGAANQL